MDHAPSIEYVPDEQEGYKLYQASGKLKGRKAVITGGDSGIGQSTAVLFAMEGAEIFFTYLPEEEKDSNKTVELVEKYGGKAHKLAVDLTDKKNCQKTVDEAMNKMGAINILFNNHAYQMMVHEIKNLKEEQWEHTFNTNIHCTYLPIFISCISANVWQPSSISPNTHLSTCSAATPSSTMPASTPTLAAQTCSTTRPPRALSSPSRAALRTSSLLAVSGSIWWHLALCGHRSYRPQWTRMRSRGSLRRLAGLLSPARLLRAWCFWPAQTAVWCKGSVFTATVEVSRRRRGWCTKRVLAIVATTCQHSERLRRFPLPGA